MYQSCNAVLWCSFCGCKHNTRKLWGSGTWFEIGHLYLHCCNFPAARSGMSLGHWQYLSLCATGVTPSRRGASCVLTVAASMRISWNWEAAEEQAISHFQCLPPGCSWCVLSQVHHSVQYLRKWNNLLLKAPTFRHIATPGLFPKLVPTESGISNLYSFIVL